MEETWTLHLVFIRYGTPAIYLKRAYCHSWPQPCELVSGCRIPDRVLEITRKSLTPFWPKRY